MKKEGLFLRVAMQKNEEQAKQEEKTEDFAFVKEKIKDKPPSKRKILSRILLTLLCAVLFGVVASLVIAFLLPKLQQRMQPEEEPEMIVIPRDERETETETETESEEETETEPETEEPSTEEESTEPIEIPEILPEQYQQLQKKLYSIGEEASRALVTVTGLTSDTDWFNEVYSNEDKTIGIIVAYTGEEVLVLTDQSVIRAAESIQVTFFDGTVADASIKKIDAVTGLSVLTVAAAELPEEAIQEARVAPLANSFSVTKGTSVLAIGINSSILTGTITQTTDRIFLADGEFTVFQTDILSPGSGNGVLVNLNGETVGFIRRENGSMAMISAISISDLKSLIELLSNGMDVPYLGLYVSTVTKSIAEQYDLPQGIYINSVEMDSPAMEANLLSGDVIVEMDGTKINNTEEYRNLLFTYSPGDSVRVVVERLGNDGYTKVSCTAEIGVLE